MERKRNRPKPAEQTDSSFTATQQSTQMPTSSQPANQVASYGYSFDTIGIHAPLGVTAQREKLKDEDQIPVQAFNDSSTAPNADASVSTRIQNTLGAGQPLDSGARDVLEPKFGHSFENVRIHADGEADALSKNLGARAFTTGQDIFFRSGEYQPGSSEGQHLLAHELVHVVQNKMFQNLRGNSSRVSDIADSAETEASSLSSRIVAGEPVCVSTAPSATVSRSVIDWLEEKIVNPITNNASELASTVSNGASNAWEGMQLMAQDATPHIVDEGTAMLQGAGLMATDLLNTPTTIVRADIDEAREIYRDTQTEGFGTAIYNGAERGANRMQRGATAIHDGMRQNAGYVQHGVQAVEAGIDTLEDVDSSVIHGLAGLVDGIPVVGEMAENFAQETDQAVQLGGGFTKGAVTMVGGLGQMVANPVDTLLGLEAMAEHVPGESMPGNFLGVNPLRVAHGLYNAATTNVTLESEMSHAISPTAALEENTAFRNNVLDAVVHPYQESIQNGKPSEAIGRGVFDIGSLLMGVGETSAAARGGEAAILAGRVAEGTELASGATRVNEAISMASRLAEGSEFSSSVSRTAEVSNVTRAAEASDITRVAEVSDVARSETTQAGEAAQLTLAGEGRGSVQASETAERLAESNRNIANYEYLRDLKKANGESRGFNPEAFTDDNIYLGEFEEMQNAVRVENARNENGGSYLMGVHSSEEVAINYARQVSEQPVSYLRQSLALPEHWMPERGLPPALGNTVEEAVVRQVEPSPYLYGEVAEQFDGVTGARYSGGQQQYFVDGYKVVELEAEDSVHRFPILNRQ